MNDLITRLERADWPEVFQYNLVKYDENYPYFGLQGPPTPSPQHPNQRKGLDLYVSVVNFSTGEWCWKKLYENKRGLHFKHTGFSPMYLDSFTSEAVVMPFQWFPKSRRSPRATEGHQRMTDETDMNQIEKVARAIWDQQRNHWGHYRDMVPDLCEWEELTQSKQRELMREAKAAIAAMQSAPQEPVAWMYERDDGSRDLLLDCNGEYARNLLELGATETPLYAGPTPPAGGSDATS